MTAVKKLPSIAGPVDAARAKPKPTATDLALCLTIPIPSPIASDPIANILPSEPVKKPVNIPIEPVVEVPSVLSVPACARKVTIEARAKNIAGRAILFFICSSSCVEHNTVN